jgi:hypothetical protein
MAELSIDVASSVERLQAFRGSRGSTKMGVLISSEDPHGWHWSVAEAGLEE